MDRLNYFMNYASTIFESLYKDITKEDNSPLLAMNEQDWNSKDIISFELFDYLYLDNDKLKNYIITTLLHKIFTYKKYTINEEKKYLKENYQILNKVYDSSISPNDL